MSPCRRSAGYNFALTKARTGRYHGAITRYLNALRARIMKCLLAFYCTLPVWSRASFGTQLGNHPPGMIGPRLLGVDKSVSSIRVTVIKCFRGCTRLLAAAATTKIYVASVETVPREPMIREKGRTRGSHAVTTRMRLETKVNRLRKHVSVNKLRRYLLKPWICRANIKIKKNGKSGAQR